MKPGLIEFQRTFSSEFRCSKFLFKQRWPDGFKCPKCQCEHYSYINSRKLYQCKNCRYQVSITAGTIFHKTRKPLPLWFLMIYLITKSKTGQSISGLQRLVQIGCYKTAWTMVHKIHQAMKERDANYQLGGMLELDDAYFGQKNVTGKRGRGAENKSVVLVAVSTREYKGKLKPAFLKMESVPTIKKQSVKDFVNKNIADGSHISTDSYTSYQWLNAEGYSHKPNKILNPKDTLKYLPWVHIMIGNVKGIIKGVHHGVSPKHLSRFLAEFCYRFNRRFIENSMFEHLIQACLNTQTITLAELRS